MQHKNRLTVSARKRDMTGSRETHPQRISFARLHALTDATAARRP
jgi:hypothetical protein